MKHNNSFDRLKIYCEREKFKGWDPFDGLNSWVIQKTFLGNSRIFRLCWIQFFKRSPINFRTIFKVKKGYNSKGLALFLIGYCNIYKIDPQKKTLGCIENLLDLIIKNQIEGYSGACWGYNFDWQARAFFQPKNTPTIVATSFVVEALLEAYKITGNMEWLNTAKSSVDFVLKDLNKSYDEKGNYTLSYSPIDNTQVFNAGLLGVKLMSLVYSFTGEERLIEESKKIITYVCDNQNTDGSWAYSALAYHQWIDSFHTGYNLECISTYQNISKDKTFDANFQKGFKYYIDNFFTKEGLPKYYNTSIYPIDIHSPAQFFVTIAKSNRKEEYTEFVSKVMNWTIDNMQSNDGRFYYQINKFFTSKVPYIRWSQAWMFYAMSYYYSK